MRADHAHRPGMGDDHRVAREAIQEFAHAGMDVGQALAARMGPSPAVDIGRIGLHLAFDLGPDAEGVGAAIQLHQAMVADVILRRQARRLAGQFGRGGGAMQRTGEEGQAGEIGRDFRQQAAIGARLLAAARRERRVALARHAAFDIVAAFAVAQEVERERHLSDGIDSREHFITQPEQHALRLVEVRHAFPV